MNLYEVKLMDVQELYDRVASSTTEEIENVIPNTCNNELQYNQTVSVKVPKPRDKMLMDISSIDNIKNECKKAKETKFSFAELLLGISSLLLGAFLSAIMSQVTYELQILSVIFYTICPALGLGCGVAYFFCRKNEIDDIKKFAEKIEYCVLNADDDEGEE